MFYALGLSLPECPVYYVYNIARFQRVGGWQHMFSYSLTQTDTEENEKKKQIDTR